LLKKGVVLRPGDASFFNQDSPKNYLHLGYSAIDTNKINIGMDIIIKQIKAMMN